MSELVIMTGTPCVLNASQMLAFTFNCNLNLILNFNVCVHASTGESENVWRFKRISRLNEAGDTGGPCGSRDT